MLRAKAVGGEKKAPTNATKSDQVEKRDQEEKAKMHYASASKAKERDLRFRSRGRRGIFGSCLSSRASKLLILVAVGFSVYCFLSSNGYLDQLYAKKVPANNAVQTMDQQLVRQNEPNDNGKGKDYQLKVEGRPRDLDDSISSSDYDYSDDDDGVMQSSGTDSDGKPDSKQHADDNDNNNNKNIFKYHVLHTLTNTHKMPHLKTRFEVCMKSILQTSSVDLLFFLVVDQPSKEYLHTALQHITNLNIAKSNFQFIFLDIDELAKELAPLVEMMQSKIQGKHPYYMESIFFLSTMLHEQLLPDYVHRVIMLDTDLKFVTDIKELFGHFDRFRGDNIIGIAHEQQPVYRHTFSLYRSQNRGTRVGGPPPDGLTGFNSGVLLLDLDKMRASQYLKHYLTPDVIVQVRDKYHFRGHLGDQDFYTLISMEKEELFYVLPCSWNKQLCQWWKDKGYQSVWNDYFVCNEKINIYHGNCNTPIPY